MRTLVGKGVSPGLAQGKAFVYRDVLQRDSELSVIDHAQIENEKTRIEDAIIDVRQSLTLDAQRIEERLGKQSADIFRAQGEILLDPSVVEELKRTLEVERINAEQVVRTVFRLLARRFRDMSNEMFRERGDDIMGSGCFAPSRSSSPPSTFPQTENSRNFFLIVFTWRKEGMLTCVCSTLAPTRIRSTCISPRSPIPFWDGAACECCWNIPSF